MSKENKIDKRIFPDEELLTIIYGIFNFVVVVFFIWSFVDFIRGHFRHPGPLNSDLVNAMSLIWFALGVLALLNSIAMHKIVEFIKALKTNE